MSMDSEKTQDLNQSESGTDNFCGIDLNNFDNGLDVLIQMVKQAKIEITDIFLSKITEQFIELVANSDISMEKASSFIDEAATLIEIKSRALLPKEETEEEEYVMTEEDYIRRLQVYETYKEITMKLQEMDRPNHFFRRPEYNEKDCRINVSNFNLDQLLDAFVSVLHLNEMKVVENEPKKVLKDRFTVAEKIQYISKEIHSEKQLRFFDLFEKDYTKSEIINTFLALLELLKQQIVCAEQPERYGDISIYLKDENAEINTEDIEF